MLLHVLYERICMEWKRNMVEISTIYSWSRQQNPKYEMAKRPTTCKCHEGWRTGRSHEQLNFSREVKKIKILVY